MNNSFSNLGVSDPIIKAIESMGFETPTKVQNDSIPYIVDKKDLIVMSKTGSGKTGAFGIPLLQSIDPILKGVQGLILTPTRELAVQVNQELVKMSKYLDLTTTAVYGQHNIKTEIDAIKKGASIITGTPGRVFDHISRKTLLTKDIKYLVLDEADRMLDMGFFEQVVQIIKTLPRKRVTLLFSATMPPEIQKICKAYMHEPITLELGSDTKTVDTIKQAYYRVEPKEKRTQLNKLLKVEQPDSCIIFCNTRSEVDWVTQYFKRKGYEIGALHGGNSQNSRMETIRRLKNEKLQIIVATDVAARGIHIDDLSLVINYDVPVDKNSYIHRIGRTGRVGNSGKAITLVTTDDMWNFYEIEEHVGVLIEELELPTDVFVKECEEASKSKWTKKRKEKAKRLSHKEPAKSNKKSSNHRSGKHKYSDHKYSGDKSKNHQRSGHKHKLEAQHNKGHQQHYSPQKPVDVKQQQQKPIEIKPQRKDIDYRKEAKKLLERVNADKKPSLLKRIGKLLKSN